MSSLAVKVKNLSKKYELYDKPIDRLKEALNPFQKKYHKEFYALKDMSFEIKKGQTIGVIGKNGSGKSTLLKLLSGILTPTSGEIEVNGKISALLELGAGFNFEFTGLENVYLNGSLMGYSRQEMDERLPAILEFADIGEFINQPVKMYSSGMFARLAFAVAISVDPDILIVDEALAVGDINFQAKCMSKFESLRNQGKTIFLVSHDLGAIYQFSEQVIVISSGQVVFHGQPKEGIDLFKKILVGNSNSDTELKHKSDRLIELSRQEWSKSLQLNPNSEVYGNKKAKITDIGIFDEKGELAQKLISNENYRFKMKVVFDTPVSDPIFTITIRDLVGKEIAGTNTLFEKVETGKYLSSETVEVTFSQKLNLASGNYLVTFACSGFEVDQFVVYERLYHILIIEVLNPKQIVGYFDIFSRIEINRLGVLR